jgi:hypothetical protein
MDLIDRYTVRDCHYFCRFELENVSSYEILPTLDLTQYVHEIQSTMSIIRKIIQHLYKNLHRETDYLKTSRN